MKLFREPTAIWVVNGAGILVIGNRQIYLRGNFSYSAGGRLGRCSTPPVTALLRSSHAPPSSVVCALSAAALYLDLPAYDWWSKYSRRLLLLIRVREPTLAALTEPESIILWSV